ncbi:hypothetical protein FDP41_004229 [Naegleria fowleri]|uniref:SAYSvFN domain-containing protein n=1 Tax=Naegleria fowleri TaxID=5763 RepID=A0A6A5BRX3_NAEFO|nr:uncharacterized protein FDP41_004229 [Naegleria fowleri]KAF0976934.1 hypothetical protein FDP41_004229 [Naegleria fowleri]CAG4709422.1 unnamed protein product [Naegleria fowleri]
MSPPKSSSSSETSSSSYEIRRPKHDLKWYLSYYRYKCKQLVKTKWKHLLILSLWISLGYWCYRNEFMTVYMIITMIGLIFYNLDWREKSKEERESTLSAWSVFNKDFKSIPGTFTADDQLRNMTGGAINTNSNGRRN